MRMFLTSKTVLPKRFETYAAFDTESELVCMVSRYRADIHKCAQR